MPVDWVYDLHGKEVVFTGKDDEYERSDLAAIARRMGASVKGDVGNSTDILVRGYSPRWKFGDYGNREQQVARMQRWGHRIAIVDMAGFHGLRSGYPAPTIAPHVPDVPARLEASSGGTLGAPYRPGQFAEPVSLSGDYFRDPDTVDRGLQAHSTTQDALAHHIEALGHTPLSAFYAECNFDMAWDSQGGTCGVAEVKSLTTDNEILQIRLGLGQVLDYGLRLRTRGFDPSLYLVLERAPQRLSHWTVLCTESGVVLTFAPDFDGVS